MNIKLNKRYEDDSGDEIAVTYTDLNEYEIKCIDTITLSEDQMEWLLENIQKIQKIKKEIENGIKKKQFDYVKSLLVDTKKLGKMHPDLTLKIIVSKVMEKYNLSQNDVIELIQEVMNDFE